MKSIFGSLLVFLAVLSVCLADNGQPGCKTEEEMTVKKYRNFWDSTRYWVCSVAGQAASSKNCENEYLFQDELKNCVHFTEWVWTPTVPPPSRP